MRDSTKCRRIVVETHAVKNPSGRLVLFCHCCGAVIDVIKDTRRWRADHIRRYAEGGQDTPDNLFPICLDCDTGKDGKAAHDAREVAKGKRVIDKHLGIRTKRPFPKHKDPWGKERWG